ncbi:hypothetical protein AAL_05124 [Moelleriella libera RCEF 2490]|uniref:Uncharacterized protein n=1 Tax=Moelleriella libera RCEF 2490 TaxID=1081109 RepID=A0A168ANZ0_9HYPO|nr:hypothetical protein AAL_05124 [Moelleriella libera RCEF 2490]
MHSPQNYGEDEAVYDDNAYTYSTTFHNGQLMLYAHHVTETPSGPEYHMTQLKGYTLTSDRETFVAGATAFRNARDLARRQRTGFIGAANVRASQSESAASQGIEAAEHSVDVPDLVPYANYGAWQDADDALQQHVAETSGLNLDHETVATSIPQNLFEEGGRRDLAVTAVKQPAVFIKEES